MSFLSHDHQPLGKPCCENSRDFPVPLESVPTKDDLNRTTAAASSGENILEENEQNRPGLPGNDVDIESGKGTETKRKPSRIIPRRKRRGLFAQLVIGIPEIDDPVQYSNKIKHFIVFIIATAAVAAPMGYSNTTAGLIVVLPFIFLLYLMSLRDFIPIRIW